MFLWSSLRHQILRVFKPISTTDSHPLITTLHPSIQPFHTSFSIKSYLVCSLCTRTKISPYEFQYLSVFFFPHTHPRPLKSSRAHKRTDALTHPFTDNGNPKGNWSAPLHDSYAVPPLICRLAHWTTTHSPFLFSPSLFLTSPSYPHIYCSRGLFMC